MFGPDVGVPESVFNLVPPEETPPPPSSVVEYMNNKRKQPRPHVPKRERGSFGPAPGACKPDPRSFLKVQEKLKPIQNLAQLRKTNPSALKPTKLRSSNKPGPPPVDERPLCNLVSNKNFVVANAVDNILAVPRKTGVEAKDYLHKEDYGKVPTYLGKIKKDIQDEYEYIRKLHEETEEAERSKVRLMTEDEKTELISALKAKWEKVNTEYQGITHMTKLDTIGKIRRKETYESKLSQIERDIAKLSKPYIFVDTTQ